MKSPPKFLDGTKWKTAVMEPLTGDASARTYFRLRNENETAILMDASRAPEILPPFMQIAAHLQKLGFSAPQILGQDETSGFLLLEDFGNVTLAQLLDKNACAEKLFALAADVLIALHKNPAAVPIGLRIYSPEKMLADAELFLAVHNISPDGRDDFQKIWREILPLAHEVPQSLLLRDFHTANLMLLPKRDGIRQIGLLDFQDAYAGPVAYDLVSLLEDARRDLPATLKEKMIERYLAEFPTLDRKIFEMSAAILAALRHTRVLAVFEKLAQDGKSGYKESHSARVERLLQQALRHPKLAALRNWFDKYAR